jgi:hypothetical protein
MKSAPLATVLALVLLFGAPASAQDTLEEAGREFPARITVSTTDGEVALRATGSTTRKKFFFKIYAAVGYIDASQGLGDDPGAAIVAAPGPKQIHLKMLREVDSERIVNGINEALEKTATRPIEEIAEERARFLAVFGTDKLAEGDDLRMTYLPGEGLEIRHNETVRDVIPGENFARAFFEIYFGPKPVEDGIKKNLLRALGARD